MSNRIQNTFDKLHQQKRKALIPFITAGDPSPQLTVPLLHALVDAGADVLELGVPFSDPMADGPTIQRASERVPCCLWSRNFASRMRPHPWC
jgi:tryptophan synthase alpha chain